MDGLDKLMIQDLIGVLASAGFTVIERDSGRWRWIVSHPEWKSLRRFRSPRRFIDFGITIKAGIDAMKAWGVWQEIFDPPNPDSE